MSQNDIPLEDTFECANCLREIDPEAVIQCECHFEHFDTPSCEFIWHKRKAQQSEGTPEEKLTALIYRAISILNRTRNPEVTQVLTLYLKAAFEYGQHQVVNEELGKIENEIAERRADGWVPYEGHMPDRPSI